MSRVEFMNVSFRDGVQSPVLFDAKKYHFSREDKVDLMKGALELGVRYFEFFSSAVSDIERADFEVLEELGHSYPCVYLLAHIRPCDVEQALRSKFDGLNIYMGLSKRA